MGVCLVLVCLKLGLGYFNENLCLLELIYLYVSVGDKVRAKLRPALA